MKAVLGCPLLLTALTLSTPVGAAILFADDFNGPAATLNWDGGTIWTVSDGTVDLVASGTFSITCVGGAGNCVDLDGSTSNAGIFATADSIDLAAGDHVLEFWYSGNQRGGAADTFTVSLGGLLSETIADIAPGQGLTLFTHNFSVASATSAVLSFSNVGGDNIGAILDNVSLSTRNGGPSPVPAPGALGLIGIGLIALAAARRRRCRS